MSVQNSHVASLEVSQVTEFFFWAPCPCLYHWAGHVIYLCRPSYQNVNSLRIDTSSSLKYLDLHLDSSGGGQSERAVRLRSPILSYPKTVFMSMYRAEHRQENKPALGVWQCHWLSVEIYGFEKLGSHHQLLIWDRKDSGRYHHKIPVSNCFFFFEFLLDAKLSHDRKSVWDGSRDRECRWWFCRAESWHRGTPY